MAQKRWEQESLPVLCLFTLLPAPWPGALQSLRITSSEERPAQRGQLVFQSVIFFLRRANRLLGTYWRTCNCSLTTSPKSSNFWVGTYLKAAACRMSPASCRELGHFSLSDWDWGEESFSSERKKELQCRQFGQLETGWQIASHWHFIHFQPMGPFLQPDKSPPMLQKSKFLTLLFLYGKEA